MRRFAIIFAAIIAFSALAPPTGVSAQGVAYCAPGQSPQFVLGFAALKAQVGPPMGNPIECEHANPENGDSLQQTTTGLSFYRKATNTPTFTDGYNHWGLTPAGLVMWTGSSVDPPGSASTSAASQPARPAPPIQDPADYLPSDADVPQGFRFDPAGSGPGGMGYAHTRNYVRANGARLSIVSTVQSLRGAVASCDGIKESWRNRGFVVFPATRFGEDGFIAFQKDGTDELWVSYFRQAAFCGGILWLNPRQPPDPDEFNGVLGKMAAKVSANPPR